MFNKLHSLYRKIKTTEFQEIHEELGDGPEKEAPDEERHIHRSHAARNILYGFALLCALLLFVGFSYGFRKPYLESNEGNIDRHLTSPCGNSSTEAKSLGCSFDQLMWAWYPPNCPHYANDEFVKAEPERPWRYYDNLHHGKAILADDENWVEILDSGIQLWGERREHLTHCVYMFLSAGQIIWGGGKFVPKLVRPEHFDHCVAILLGALRHDDTWFNIETNVPSPSFENC